MVQLEILSGKKAGTTWIARRFPIHINRSPTADLRLEEAGMWDRHLTLSFAPAAGIELDVAPNAIASVNGQPVQHTILHNGDCVEAGSAKIKFWLSETHQAGLRMREWLAWGVVVAVTASQIALIYHLLN